MRSNQSLCTRVITRGFALLIFFLWVITAAMAQKSVTDGLTPLGLSPGTPAGSYGLSGFDNVNLYNGSLNFQLPLLTVGGRGSAGYKMTLPIEQVARLGHRDPPDYNFR